jgi:hypothetical protein
VVKAPKGPAPPSSSNIVPEERADRFSGQQRREPLDADSDLDTDVRRDVSFGHVGTIVLGVLIGLCVVGIIVTLAATSGSPRRYSSASRRSLLTLLFAALDILVSIVCIRALIREWMSSVRERSAGRVIGLIGLTVFVIVAVLAVVSFFTATCFSL